MYIFLYLVYTPHKGGQLIQDVFRAQGEFNISFLSTPRLTRMKEFFTIKCSRAGFYKVHGVFF